MKLPAAQSFMKMIGLGLRSHPTAFIGIVVASALASIFPLASALLTKLVFDLLGASLQAGDMSSLPRNLIPIFLGYATVTTLTKLTHRLIEYLHGELQRNVSVTIASNVYRKANQFVGIAYFEDPQFHNGIHLASRGAQFGPAQSILSVLALFQGFVSLVSFFTVLVVFDPFLTLFVTAAALPRLYVHLGMGRRRFRLAVEVSPEERRASYFGNLMSGIEAAKEIRLFGLGEYFLQQFVETSHHINDLQRQQQLREMKIGVIFEILSTVVSTSSFIVIVLRAFVGRLSIGDVTLYVTSVQSVQDAFTGIVYGITSLQEQTIFFNEYEKMKALPEPIKIAYPARQVPEAFASIELRNVSFRYSENHPWILSKVNLSIPAGSCFALVGVNGVGKTTLVKLLTRLYDPTEGEILWNGINIRDFSVASLRSCIAVILQDFVHYQLQAQENIGVGCVAMIDDIVRIREAAEWAGIHDVIERLPNGYQTTLSRTLGSSPNGADISGGEWQKVAIARMFMRKAKLLILDEPTAALDAGAEADLYHRIKDLTKGSTTILISHRFSTVRMADTVAVLEKGQITECGSHRDLMALGKTYSKLYTMQVDRDL